MKDTLKQAVRKTLLVIRDMGVSLLGITGWLFHALPAAIIVGSILGTTLCLLTYAKVKPNPDERRELIYDKLAQMERTDLSKLSDTVICDKDGRQIGLINAGHYQYVGTTGISINVQNIYIAQEDRCLKSYAGVGWIAIFHVGLALVKHRGQVTQGGGIIAQQVIKNTYLTQEQTFTHKTVEILLAPEIEKKYSKADIMEFYCNINFYGYQCYGAEATSRYYFGRHAADLNVEGAAVLVGISNNPSTYDPVAHPKAPLEKRNDVLKNMNEIGELSDEDYKKALSKLLTVVKQKSEGTDENYQSSYAIHCAALKLLKKDGFQFRYTSENKDDYNSYMERYTTAYMEKPDLIRVGGLEIHTFLNSSLQDMLQADIDQGLFSHIELQDNGKYALQSAGAIVDNQSNYVVATVGGRGSGDQFNRVYLSARQPGNTIKPLIDYDPAFDTGEYYPTRTVSDHKWGDGPSNSDGSYHGSATVREALNRNLNTVARQILEDIGVDYNLNYLGEMEFQKLIYVDNGVPSLSIGGFANGVRVVDMAKGYSTLTSYGVYNDRTCIIQIIHEYDGDLIKGLPPAAKQVYCDDSAFMLTDTLKDIMTSPCGTGRGLELDNDMPAAGKTGTTNSSKDTWFCDYTCYYTTAVRVGYDIPHKMPGICGSTYTGKIWKDITDQIHEGLEPWDWEQPESVELKADPRTGTQGYFNTTAEFRAQQSLHDKEQAKLTAQLEQGIQELITREISFVEDTYSIKSQYQDITSRLPFLDDGELRAGMLEQVENRYDYFTGIISQMGDITALYEKQKVIDDTRAREEVQKQVKEDRKQAEKDTKKNEFLQTLGTVEELEYQQKNAQDPVQDAIGKPSLMAGDPERQALSDRLQATVTRVPGLPTGERWNAFQAEGRASEEAVMKQAEQQVQAQQNQLRPSLDSEKFKWNNVEYYGPGGRPDDEN